MAKEIGEQSTRVEIDPMGVFPTPRPAGHLVLEAQRAKVFGALFTQPVLRRLGRYVVLDVLGQGGMGVVLKGYDDELDRQVAIKVLHGDLGEQEAARLRREAQAMAKLSHPNVVQVYEVGEVEGQTFVAMELCKGRTVRQWMQQEPRPGWKACVEVFVQLGQGLAAAHKRGLVHRDFKPGNAIVDEEGRAKVLDFGLARQGEEDGKEEPPISIQRKRTDRHEAVPLEQSLTETGTVLGTPAYMPPEQMDGSEADARSDQFSFCVALYEAVYGERPFEGGSMAALMASVKNGSILPAPLGSQVPVALRSVLLRGLAVAAEQRWPSMEVLLEELRRLVTPRRRAWWALGLAGGLGALGAAVAYQAQVAREAEDARQAELAQRCSGAWAQLDGIWDEGRRQEVKAAILGTGLSYAPGTWERVEPRLDDYAAAWAGEHTEVCEATAVRHEQSEEHMGLRMGCLRERRLHLRATVDELARADAKVVEHAVEAVASLPGLERCADVEALLAEVPPPEDPAVAERVATLDEQLVEAKAKQESGRYAEGLAVAESVVAEAETLEYEPLMARAWLRQGLLQIETGDYEVAVEMLRKAYDAALARRMMAEAAEASSSLVFILSYSLARYDEARRWAADADPLSRAAGTDETRANYLNDLGNVAQEQGKLDEARDLYQRALTINEKALGPDHPSVAANLGNLGTVAWKQGKLDEARDSHQRALAIFEKVLGPDHPNVAMSLHGLGNLAASRGQLDEARDSYQRALALWENALGSDHPSLALSLVNLGTVARKQGRLEEAHGLYQRALALWENALGPDHPNVAASFLNLGVLAQKQGKLEEARDSYQRALAIFEKVLGPDQPPVAASLVALGIVAQKQGKLDEARDFHERALAIYEKAQGPDHSSVANSLTPLAEALLGLEQPADALALLERALAIRTTHEVDSISLTETRFALARALWAAPTTRGRDRARARTLAEQARAALATVEDRGDANIDLAEIDTWLAEHRLP